MFCFDQPPINWDQNVPWEPVNIMLVPNIPGRHKCDIRHKVMIAYTTGPAAFNNMGYRFPSQARIKAMACDKSTVR